MLINHSCFTLLAFLGIRRIVIGAFRILAGCRVDKYDDGGDGINHGSRWGRHCCTGFGVVVRGVLVVFQGEVLGAESGRRLWCCWM